MSTWDERAMERANLFYPPPEGELGLTYPLEALRDGKRDAFVLGAAWQREQLLTDEAIERAARELNAAGWACLAGAHEPGEYDDCPYCRVTCLNMARVALTAAIGDQE